MAHLLLVCRWSRHRGQGGPGASLLGRRQSSNGEECSDAFPKGAMRPMQVPVGGYRWWPGRSESDCQRALQRSRAQSTASPSSRQQLASLRSPSLTTGQTLRSVEQRRQRKQRSQRGQWIGPRRIAPGRWMGCSCSSRKGAFPSWCPLPVPPSQLGAPERKERAAYFHFLASRCPLLPWPGKDRKPESPPARPITVGSAGGKRNEREDDGVSASLSLSISHTLALPLPLSSHTTIAVTSSAHTITSPSHLIRDRLGTR